MVPGLGVEAPVPPALVGAIQALTLVIGLLPSGSASRATASTPMTAGTAAAGAVSLARAIEREPEPTAVKRSVFQPAVSIWSSCDW
jgi:hypothetical protein